MDYLSHLERSELESNQHSLLEPKPQTYSHTTVRRAFIVWVRLGQKNQYKDVCDYYHRLEAMEEQMSSSMRAASRNHEFSLFTSHPPASPYLQAHFPQLYSSPHPEHAPVYLHNCHMVADPPTAGLIIEEIKEETVNVKDKGAKTKKLADAKIAAAPSDKEIFESSKVFRSDCKYNDVKQKNRIGLAFAKLNINDDVKLSEVVKTEDKGNESTGTSKKEIVETSQLIKKYCTSQQVPLNNFLESFKEYASRCELTNTVTNVGFYIKRKMVQAELGFAITVHKAKIYNNGHKESQFNSTSPTNGVNCTTKLCGTLNIDNEALVNGFAKLSMQAKANNNDGSKSEVSTAKVFGVKGKNIDKKVAVMKGEDIELKNNTGFSNTHLTKIDTVKCRKI